jgi:hypothetical protein
MSSFLCKCQIHVLIYFLVHFVHVYNYVLHHKNEPLWPYTKRDGLENRRKSYVHWNNSLCVKMHPKEASMLTDRCSVNKHNVSLLKDTQLKINKWNRSLKGYTT